MSALVQITEVPPLHQSTSTLTACPVFYASVVRDGKRKPGSLESARGNQIHETMARYTSWCAVKNTKADLPMFDKFAEGAGPTAARILSGIRDYLEIDYEHLLATELTMALDEKFRPTAVDERIEESVKDSEEPPAYMGTLDAIYLIREEQHILIPDYKSHARPFEPSDDDKALQGKMYSLFALLHFPWCQSVTFRLIFVRYSKLTREVTYERKDLPKLVEAVKAARDRQRSIHNDMATGKKLQAYSGSQCCYCPLLTDRSCPIASLNENAQATPEEWVRWDIWDREFSRANRKRMKDHIQKTGRAITVPDYNGKIYKFGPKEHESDVMPLFHGTSGSIAFRCTQCGNASDHAVESSKCPKCWSLMRPIMPIVSLLEDYAVGNPGDTGWMGKITLSSSSITSYLKAKARAFLHQSIQDSSDKVTKVKMEVSKPLDEMPNDEPNDDEWDEDGDF